MHRNSIAQSVGPVVLLGAIALLGCNSEVTQSDIDAQQQNVTEAQDKLEALEQRQQVEDDMESQLAGLKAEIDGLKDRASGAEGDREVELKGEIAELETKLEQAKEQLRELRAASGDRWAQLQIKTEESWQEVSEAVKRKVKDWQSDEEQSDASSKTANDSNSDTAGR